MDISQTFGSGDGDIACSIPGLFLLDLWDLTTCKLINKLWRSGDLKVWGPDFRVYSTITLVEKVSKIGFYEA